MTWPPYGMRPRVCQADSTCERPPRFQARLEAVNGMQPVRKNAEACAGHLTELVRALTAWARDHDLTDGQLTVLAIDPPLSGSCLLAPADHDRPEMQGFVFSTIRLTE
jgi:hypothetical protein